MSRIVWVGVGAAGGIYLYRRGNRAWDEAKERGLAGNAAILASSASTMLNHAKRTLAEAQEAKNAEMAEDRSPGMLVQEPGRMPGYYQQRELVEDPQNARSLDQRQGRWQDPQDQDIYEVAPKNGTGSERLASRGGRRAARVGVGRSKTVQFMTQRMRSSA